MGRGSRNAERCAAHLLLFLGTLAGGCQEGYPIPATRCDEWCTLTKNEICQTYEPAQCVRACELQGLSRPECAEPFEALLACLRASPPARNCFDPVAHPCAEEQGKLMTCSAETRLGETPPFGFPK